MKNLLSAAWKNSWRPNIGQFEIGKYTAPEWICLHWIYEKPGNVR